MKESNKRNIRKTIAKEMSASIKKNESVKKPTTEIFEYIRRNKGGKKMKVGVILGVRVKNAIKIGWSKCNISKDKFDPLIGLQYAMTRAMKPEESNAFNKTPVPLCIRKQVRKFSARAVRYFKDATSLVMPSV